MHQNPSVGPGRYSSNRAVYFYRGFRGSILWTPIGIFAEWNGHSFYFTGDTLANPKLEEMAAKKPEFLFICINGKLGNMNADEAVQLTNVLKPKVAVPTHYGMFASNTEDPEVYTSRISCGYIMELGKAVSPEEMLAAVL